MPLPPVGIDAWRRFAADRWKDATEATIGRVKSGLWDVQAEDAISRLRPLRLPEPEPLAERYLYQPPEPAYEPPSPAPPESPLQALSGGIGSTLSGIGERASTALSGAQAGVGGWASRAEEAIDTLGAGLAEFGGGFLEEAGATGQAAASAVRTVQGEEREALRALTGQGPQGPEPTTLPEQLGGALGYLVPPQYRAPGRFAGEFVEEQGGSPLEQAAATGAMSVFGPGGTLSSIRTGLQSQAPNVVRALPAAGALLGATGGIATGVAAGAPPEELLARGAEGSAIGGGVGELGTLLPAVPYVFGRGGDLLGDLARRYGAAPDEALGIRAGRPPTGPSAPGAGMTPEQLAQRVRDAEEALHLWEGGGTPEYDYVARLLRAGQQGEVLPEGSTDWNALVGSGRLDPDALNRALIAYREEGLAQGDALARALGTPEERLARLQLGAAAGGARDPSGLTGGLLQKAIDDLAVGGRPFVTQSEGGAFRAGRNAPPSPTSKKNAWEYVDKKGQSWWLSTPYEVLFAKQLDENPNVAYWAQSSPEAVMETTVRHGGEPKVFTPDFIIVGTDGRIQVVEIKNAGAYKQVPWRVPEKLREAEAFFNAKGVGFSIFVEDQLGRQAMGRITPDDLLPNAEGRMGVRDGFFVESEEGTKAGRFDPQAARQELVRRLHRSSAGWDLNELGYLSGRHPLTQEEYDEVLGATHWPAWSGRRARGTDPNRGPAPITADQRRKIIAAGVGGVDPAEGGFGRAYQGAYPLPPEQGGYRPEWTPHRAFAEFNERQVAKGAPTIAVDAVEAYPQMRRQALAIGEEWARQVADGQHGLTADPLTGGFGVPGRYAVSIFPHMELELPGTPADLHPDRLAMWMAEAAPLLEEVPGARVGIWYNQARNRTYVDLSVGLDDPQLAEALGKRLSQYTVFDSVTKQDIALRYPGLPLGERPPLPTYQEQKDALVWLGRRRARRQPGGAGLPGAAPAPDAGAADAGTGAGVGGRAGRLAGGVPGAEAPGPAGAPGQGGAGLGGLEPGGVGPEGLDAAPYGAYPPPVPYAGASGVTAGRAPGAGLAPRPGGLPAAFRGAVDALAPAGAAATRGQRAFDLTTGTAGGLAAAGTAEEDATWEERAGRFALGSAAGALVGPTGRSALGAVGRSGALDEAGLLGARGGRGRGRAGARGRTPATPTPTPGGLLGDVATVTTGLGLGNPASLFTNLTGGVLRTATRVARELAGETGNPLDAFTDLAGMGAELFGQVPRFFREVGQGPTQAGQQLVGQRVGGRDLTRSQHPLAKAATIGTRVNAATDEVIGALNEAGARAVALRRGEDPNAAGKRAQEFATYRNGLSSPIADLLSKGGSWLSDPTKSAGTRLLGGLFYTFAPYVRMPERLLVESVKTVLDPYTQTPRWLRRWGTSDAAERAVMREARARVAVGTAVSATLYSLWAGGNLTGEPPSDPAERRRREAEGAQWNTLRVGGVPVPLGALGDLGNTASLLASTLTRGQEAIAAGEDPGEIATAVGNEVLRWSLSESYLRDLAKLGSETLQGRGVEQLQRAAGRVAARPLAPLRPFTAADPVEREEEGFLSTLQARVPGLRERLPERLDPSTGEALPRRGSGLTRALGMDFGPGQTETARELARYGITPREIRAGDEYAGMEQTAEQARTIQRALGSEAGRLVRETTASSEYRQADEAGKEQLLRRALDQAADEADIAAGEGVARDPKRQAQRAWDAVPRFEGVKGAPDDVRRENLRVRRARSALSAAKTADPRNGERRFRDEHPEQYRLAQRDPISANNLRARREAIEKQYGVQLP